MNAKMSEADGFWVVVLLLFASSASIGCCVVLYSFVFLKREIASGKKTKNITADGKKGRQSIERDVSLVKGTPTCNGIAVRDWAVMVLGRVDFRCRQTGAAAVGFTKSQPSAKRR